MAQRHISSWVRTPLISGSSVASTLVLTHRRFLGYRFPTGDHKCTTMSDVTISNSGKRHLAGVAMATFASFGGILLGYDTGTINGILQMPDWLRTFGNPIPNAENAVVHFSISTSVESLVVSILSAGTFLGRCTLLSLLRPNILY